MGKTSGFNYACIKQFITILFGFQTLNILEDNDTKASEKNSTPT